jgi:signal transduction histidine kinase
VLVSVTDTGTGLNNEELMRIFQPFEQAESTKELRKPGTGLGLSLSRRIVELHGGTIWAESEGPGRGSRFCFTLPLGGESQAGARTKGAQAWNK